jgi:hypothetical protein
VKLYVARFQESGKTGPNYRRWVLFSSLGNVLTSRRQESLHSLRGRWEDIHGPSPVPERITREILDAASVDLMISKYFGGK